ncbi:hydantoinase B/oxoprolinase family protein [Gymnodinialimonas ceratoperidinii]|uniref:Hydantoinase B/oxoprolinase family protein n=2 Tax=Gymnodinialimonas ceratoperidinii TaxID=2856823 RepID=A0A8F6YBA3_9RHOB|nr:hydantoinase B/oxoprolinase family protein [Gymnodinialimonas ceratoperidinii]
MIAMSIIHERLKAVAEDIGHLLVRGAFSSNIKERRDCSTAIFDATGRLVAQADHMPIHIGSLLWGVRALLDRYTLDDMSEGDAFVMNDPYLAGGTHLPDISVITPVFVDGALSYFVGNIAHHADVGGPEPGSVSGASPNIFWEGIRIPPIRIARAGVPDEDVIGMIGHNTREPMERILDLRNQIGANQRGVALLQALIADHGASDVQDAVERIIAHAGALVRAAVAALPDGEWHATRYLDDDGAGSDPVPLACCVRIAGSQLTLDFAGSGPTAKGAINLSPSSLEATVGYAVKALLGPTIPSNSGLIDAVRINVPAESVVNASPPAAVAARAVTSNRLAGAIFDALGQALPEADRMSASNDSTSLIVLAGHDPARGTSYVYPESTGGGAGAFAEMDGADAVHVHTVNSANLPVEVLETEYPILCTEYALVPDSGGAGRRRGGLGIARELQALVDGTALTVRSDGHLFGAPGVLGGLVGSTTRITHTTATDTMELPSKCSRTLAAGERLRIETLGGGGFGPVSEREASEIAADIIDGKVSRAAAERDYGAERVAACLSS